MFKKVIVGVDGREAGSDAVALAQKLAASDATIILVNAFPYDTHPSRAMLHGYEELLRQDTLKMLTKEGDDPRFERSAIPEVSPARALHDAAEDEAADLIVVGSCHRGVVGRAMLGSVGRALLHGATCPVAVAPRGYRQNAKPVRVIGVGLDQSPESDLALERAAELAAEVGGEVRLFSVSKTPVAFAPGYAYTYDWSSYAEEHRKTVQHTLEGQAAGLRVPATCEVVSGLPADELEKLSQWVDVLVLGSRKWGAVRRVVLGSTSDRLAHHAACPVLVVPAPAEQHRDRQGVERQASRQAV